MPKVRMIEGGQQALPELAVERPTRGRRRNGDGNGRGGDLGFEAKLWQAADLLRGNLDAAEHKHVVLGLIFLKYISDAFEEKHAALGHEEGADPEDPDEYLAENIFWVPVEARWSFIQERAKQPEIGKILGDAMVAIEQVNQRLRVLVRRVLRKYGYPPDKREQAVTTVLRQAELFADQWAA